MIRVGRFEYTTWPFLAIRKTRVLPERTTDDGRRTTDETGLPPLFFEQKIAKIFIAKIWLAILKTATLGAIPELY